MRSVTRPFDPHDLDALFDFFIGYVQSELPTQYVLELCFILQPAFVRTPICIAYRDARVVHRDPVRRVQASRR